MKRLVASLSIVSLLAIGCSGTPTAPLSLDGMNAGALLECGSNTNNANNLQRLQELRQQQLQQPHELPTTTTGHRQKLTRSYVLRSSAGASWQKC
jgi:hypothetical protein